MEPVADLLVSDRFRLVRELGRGGMGAVWVAHDVRLDSPCALKFIDPAIAAIAGMRGRFEREAKAAAQLRSSHVVQILDHGDWSGRPYIAMELLEGEDLAARLDRVGRLAPAQTALIVGQTSRALGRAHAAGIVHRDLKPENVFLVRDHDVEVVKVLDFGIAKVSALAEHADNRTKTGTLLGSPAYMSPEQANGTKPVDRRSDLWSLAVVTYQCLTGKLPFQSDALGDLLMRIMSGPIPVPSSVAPDLPRAFDAWWARAMSRDPDGRFQTATELWENLVRALGLTPTFESVVDPASNPRGSLPEIATGAATVQISSAPTFAGHSRSTVPLPPRASRARIAALIAAPILVGASVVAVFAARAGTSHESNASAAPMIVSAEPAPTPPEATAAERAAIAPPVVAPIETAGAATPSSAPAPVPAASVRIAPRAPALAVPARASSAPAVPPPKPPTDDPGF